MTSHRAPSERDLLHFQGQLADRAVLRLPADRPAAASTDVPTERQSFCVPEHACAAAREFAAQEGVPVELIFLTAFATLLHRYTATESLIIGLALRAADRPMREESGPHTNALPIKISFTEQASFRSLLRQVCGTAEALHAHDGVTLEELLGALAIEPGAPHHPLFQVAFACGGGAPVRAAGAPPLDLELRLIERSAVSGGTPLGFVHRTDRFDAATVQRMAGHLRVLIQGALAAPDAPLSLLPILTQEEQQLVTVTWNATARPLSPLCVHQLFEQQSERTPDSTAVVCGDRALSYAELERRANQLAHALAQVGVGHASRVALFMERSIDSIVSQLAVLKAGGAYIPLDTETPVERLAFMLKDSQPSAVLVKEASRAALPPCTATVLCLDTDAAHIESQSPARPAVPVDLSSLAALFYTSGTTGKPRGVMQLHRGIVAWAAWLQRVFPLGPADGELLTAPLSFGLSVAQLYHPLANGAKVVLLPPRRPIDGALLVESIAAHGCTAWIPVPPLLNLALGAGLAACTSLKYVLCTASALSAQLQSAFFASVKAQLHNGWGATECFLATALACSAERTEVGTVSVGAPIDNMELYVLDKHLRPVPIGIPGELCVGGANLARGYLNHPELTAAKFVQNPFLQEPDARIYRTGDLARWRPDGTLEFIGRADFQVKVRGLRVELGDIESALLRHPGLTDAVVIAREDGDGDTTLVAYVVPTGAAPTASELRAFLRTILPEYMMPGAYVCLEALPLGPNKKVDRAALPPPSAERPALDTPYRPPATPLESELAGIWAEQLKLDRVGADDPFFELGGDSLKAVALTARMAAAVDVKLPLGPLLERFTVASVAAYIEEARAGRTHEAQPGRSVTALEPEVVLDPALRACAERAPDPPRGLFLTGATGFLGRHLARDLAYATQARIYCLVRAESASAARARLRQQLEADRLWDERLAERLIAVVGDLARPLFGLNAAEFDALATQVDAIYHSGAAVSLVQPYASLRAANVLGTQEVLRLATARTLKPVHHVSTVAVGVEREDGELRHCKRLPTGYAQSKWVAERLVHEASRRGVPVSVYRPVEITWDSTTGIMNEADAVHRIVKACVQLGCIPPAEALGRILPRQWTPVDRVSRALVYLSLHGDAQRAAPAPDGSSGNAPRVYHLVGAQKESWEVTYAALLAALRGLRHRLDVVPYEVFIERLRVQSERDGAFALAPMARLFLDAPDHLPQLELRTWLKSESTLRALAKSEIEFPSIDEELVQRYVQASFPRAATP